MINGDGGCGLPASHSHRLAVRVSWYGPELGGRLRAVLYSLHEPGELLQWLCPDDSTINIVLGIIIIIVIISIDHPAELEFCHQVGLYCYRLTSVTSASEDFCLTGAI